MREERCQHDDVVSAVAGIALNATNESILKLETVRYSGSRAACELITFLFCVDGDRIWFRAGMSTLARNIKIKIINVNQE